MPLNWFHRLMNCDGGACSMIQIVIKYLKKKAFKMLINYTPFLANCEHSQAEWCQYLLSLTTSVSLASNSGFEMYTSNALHFNLFIQVFWHLFTKHKKCRICLAWLLFVWFCVDFIFSKQLAYLNATLSHAPCVILNETSSNLQAERMCMPCEFTRKKIERANRGNSRGCFARKIKHTSSIFGETPNKKHIEPNSFSLSTQCVFARTCFSFHLKLRPKWQ